MSTKTKNKEQKIPKWFKGQIYEEGAKVRNQFSGSTYELTNVELSIYDFIMGSQMMFGSVAYNNVSAQQLRDFEKALYWFRVNNPRAYMVLLD